MLGLGLGKFGKGVKSGIAKLLSSLKRRAEYFENKKDSKSEIKVLKDYELLDKATILLTPTATSDARVHSVKTYTGENVLTGNNSTFDSGIGDWQVYNGASGASVAHSTDKLEVTLSSSEGGARINTSSLFTGGQAGKTLKVRARIWKGTSTHSTIAIYVGSVQKFVTISSTPTYFEAFLKPTSTGYLTIYRAGTGSTGTYFIDDVSVVDVSSDFDFDRASSATRINSSGLVQDMQSITDPELVLNGDFEELGDETTPASDFSTSAFETNPTSGSVSESNGTLTFNNSTSSGTQVQLKNRSISDSNTYKITFTLSDFTSGSFRMSVGNNLTDTINYNDVGAEGTHTFYVTKTGGSARNYFYTGGTSVVVSNISVKEVDPNNRWSVANSDANNYVEFTEGFARLKFLNTSPITTLNSTLTLEANKTYELVVDVHDVTSGAIKIDAAGLSELFNTEGVTTRYLKPTGNTTLSFYRATADVDITLASVSVKDITFSTDVDLARINYDSNGDNGHILLEPTSTNLVTYSEEFDHSSGYWNTPNTTVETTSITSPDGSNNTYKLFADTGSSTHYLDYDSYSGASSGQTYTFSLFVKSAGSDFVQIASSSGFPARYQNFNLSTGAKASGDISNATIEAYPNGWYRVSVTETTNGTSRRFLIIPALTDMARNASFAGNAQEDGVYIFGAQLEQLSYATSYIPTLTGSTVTRATETLTGSGNSTLINSTEGVLYAEIAALANDGNWREISLNDGSTNNAIEIRYKSTDDDFQFVVRNGGTVQASPTRTLTNPLEFMKVAFSYKTDDCKMYINGVEVATDTSGTMPSGLNNLSFDWGGTNPFYGKCKALAVFNEALEDDELELLTGVTNYGSFGELASANGYTII